MFKQARSSLSHLLNNVILKIKQSEQNLEALCIFFIESNVNKKALLLKEEFQCQRVKVYRTLKI